MTSAAFTEKNEFALRKLVAFMTISEGFTLAMVESALPQDTDQLLEFLQEHPACVDHKILVLEVDDSNLRFLLDELQARFGEALRDETKEKVVIVRGLEQAIGVDEYPPVLVDLNFSRDAYRRRVPCPLVFVLPDYAITQMARYAPDFWAWKSAECRLAAPEKSATPPSFRDLVPDLPSDRKVIPVPQERFTLLNRLLEDDYKDESRTRADLLLERSRAYQSHAQFRLAEADAVAALELYEKPLEPDDLDIAEGLYQLVSVRLDLGEFKELEPLVQRSLSIRKDKLGDKNLDVAKSLNSLGNLYRNVGRYRDAIIFYQQFLEIARELKDRKREAVSLGNLGSAYQSLGEYQRAIAFYQQSLEIDREIGNRRGEASSLGNLGNAYYRLGEYQRAIAFYQQSLEIKREIGNRRGEASSLGGLGNAYQSLGEYQRAISFYQQWLDIAREIGDRRGEATSLGNLGNAYGNLGEYQQAISFHEQALVIEREIGDKNGLARNTYNSALSWAKLGHKLEAQQNILAAKALYEEMGVEYMIENCEDALRKILQIVDAETVEPLWTPDSPTPQSAFIERPDFSVSPDAPPGSVDPLPSAFQIQAPKTRRRSPWQRFWQAIKRFLRNLFSRMQ